ncbi:hypothetical protein FSARC_14931 [Fusarium sarcochroum]|uniref:Uncharacterized protein n=1 Tax=Fusarium sarcochroum TaxID=1208366 RepID=A0A8H4WMS9_9HYPO|nr:hypothetical protein FSARC_14931 [Fusarium sarcochroum]
MMPHDPDYVRLTMYNRNHTGSTVTAGTVDRALSETVKRSLREELSESELRSSKKTKRNYDGRCLSCPDSTSCRMPYNGPDGKLEYLRPACLKLHELVIKYYNGEEVDEDDLDNRLRAILVALSPRHLAQAVATTTQKLDVLETFIGEKFADYETDISALYSQLDAEKRERARLQGEIHDLQGKVNALSTRHTPDTQEDSEEQGDTDESDESQSEVEDNLETTEAPEEVDGEEVA